MTPAPTLRLVRDDARTDESGDLLPLAALTLVWLAVAIVVDPRGSFPLDDDWAYGSVALNLARTGHFRPSFWQSMPLVTQAWWGAAFARWLGLSWFALRLSSLVAGWLALLGGYRFFREIGWRQARAAAGAATLLANPWLVALSCTFMTDVPFLAAVTWSAWAWLRAIGRRDARWLALAAALSVVATLDRQVGLALPIAFTVPILRRQPFARRSLAAALLPLGAALVALAVHDHFRHACPIPAALYDVKSQALVRGLTGLGHLHAWTRTAARLAVALAYLGLFSLPVAMMAGAPGARLRATWPLTYTLGAGAGIAAIALGWSMPLIDNIVVDFGIGPRTMAGHAPSAPIYLWRAITILAGIGAAFLVGALGARWRVAWRGDGLEGHQWKPLASSLVALALFAPSALADTAFFDRHLLVLLPLVLAVFPAEERDLCAPNHARSLGVAAAAAIALVIATLAAFSVGATHDYLAWHRARWSLVQQAETRHDISRELIQAGFELDNLGGAGGSATALADRRAAPFVVSASPLPCHDQILRQQVHAWLPWSVREIYLLARPDKDSPCGR